MASEDFTEQVATVKQQLRELAKKANLHKIPDVSVSKNERFASVNIFQKRISVGTYLLSLWKQGKLSDDDVEATLAHEVGHLMDFRCDSGSTSFRNLLVESLWFSFGVVPLAMYLFAPEAASAMLSGILALEWAVSIPFIVRQVDFRVEFEADRNAATLLVAPQKLSNALFKISCFAEPSKAFSFTSRLSFLAGKLTHPSFAQRRALISKSSTRLER